MIKELSEQEFKNTFGEKMNELETVEKPIDIWPYVSKLVDYNIVENQVLKNKMIEIAYRNNSETFDHVLLRDSEENKYIVIVVDLLNRTIHGHYLLNLNKEYEINENS